MVHHLKWWFNAEIIVQGVGPKADSQEDGQGIALPGKQNLK